MKTERCFFCGAPPGRNQADARKPLQCEDCQKIICGRCVVYGLDCVARCERCYFKKYKKETKK
ncbi:hypothetical protein A2303_07210 [Candidatus Falkowbacteria bacterium RIFOXYB2_FULL_47_14]|uniref:Uncharacterized protein n=1 Tax=Candidatus Falkowbacteria bacterium RIFOXYA2_FULL_47_19 TaxID=1797994 RepID=A0A1F5SGF3_9BACT|nr:MAG: hypothetical protein A2227_00955 [Candidatus Falkowbacteria bacterium RIFOXYA2_FULL_47_19]OGF34936.1 MAG: hypothetical protein A2468_06915 [Candidatus Falkowbacteria bacterium RIFOXYC2_FULL_46_15]OGF43651.1 MAG: hypothetical protein A2303_07210 [Candidatus Falkowbacteria bacterium RIFOXYB2_FULL_47_14]